MGRLPTSTIIDALNGDRDALTLIRHTSMGNWARTDEGMAAAERLAELQWWVDCAAAYIRDCDTLAEMAHRGVLLFGNTWTEAIDFHGNKVTP